MTKEINFKRTTDAKGRYGILKQTGIEVLETEQTFMLSPMTKMSVSVACFLEIPKENVAEVCEALIGQRLCILRLVGGIEPEIWGPYKDENERQRAAQEMFPGDSYFDDEDTILLMDGMADFHAPSDEYFEETIEDFIGDIFTPEQ